MKSTINALSALAIGILFSGCSEAYFYRQHEAKTRSVRIDAAKHSTKPAKAGQVIGTWRRVSFDVETADVAKLLEQEQFEMEFMPDFTWQSRTATTGKPSEIFDGRFVLANGRLQVLGKDAKEKFSADLVLRDENLVMIMDCSCNYTFSRISK